MYNCKCGQDQFPDDGHSLDENSELDTLRTENINLKAQLRAVESDRDITKNISLNMLSTLNSALNATTLKDAKKILKNGLHYTVAHSKEN